MRRCLIVSPQFPPSTLAGVHRARHLAKHLNSFGWQPTVITVDPSYHTEQLDPALAKLVSSSATVIRTGATPLAWTSWFGLRGDIGIRAFFHLWKSIKDEITKNKHEIVLITGAPFFPMLLSRWIKKSLKTPVILDFQDPWVSKEGETLKRWTKGWFSHNLAVLLEPLSLRSSSWVTSVSDRQNIELSRRYPWLNAKRMTAVPIGGDPDDYLAIQDENESVPFTQKLTFSYVGSTWPRGMPLLLLLVAGIAEFKRQQPQLAQRVLFRFVGTSNRPGKNDNYRVLPLSKLEGVDDLIHEEPGRVAFLDALRILSSSHALCIFGSDEPHYTASKIYPTLMSGKPFISLFHEESSAHQVLLAAGGGAAIPWNESATRADIVASIASAIYKLATDPKAFGTINSSAYADFTGHAVARCFAKIFNECSILEAAR